MVKRVVTRAVMELSKESGPNYNRTLNLVDDTMCSYKQFKERLPVHANTTMKRTGKENELSPLLSWEYRYVIINAIILS